MVTEHDVAVEAIVDVEVMEDVAEFIEAATGEPANMGEIERTAAQDPDIPVGEVLASAPLNKTPGATINWTKRDTMVRAGNKPLPERFAAYDRNNIISMLPTAQMAYMLSKPHPLGGHVFRLASKGPYPDVPVPTPIDGLTCDWCNETRPPEHPKVFYRQAQVEPHMVAVHNGQWTALLRVQAQERQEEALSINRALLQAQLETQKVMIELMSQGRTAAAVEVAQGAGLDTSPVTDAPPALTCPDCEQHIKSGKQAGLVIHQRRWCSERDKVI